MPTENPILDYLNAIVRHWLVVACTLAIGVTLTLFTVRVLPDVYRSTTLIMVEPQDVPQTFVMPTITTRLEERLNALNQEVLSRTRLEAIINDLNLYAGQQKEGVPRENIVDTMRRHIQIEVFANHNAFRISFEGDTPQMTQQVTGRLASLYINENLKIREQHATGTTEFLENELQKAKRRLDQQDAQIQKFKQEHMGALPEQQDANMRALDGLRFQQQTVSMALSAAKERKLSLEKQVSEARAAPSVAAGTTSTTGVPATSPRARLQLLQALLADLRSRYTDEHPDVIATQHRISQLQAQLSAGGDTQPGADPSVPPELARAVAGVDLEISRLKTVQDNVEKSIAKYQERVEKTFPNEEQMLSLTRDYEVTKKEYQSMLDKKLDAQVSQNLEERQKGERFRVLDPANLPESPVRPNRRVLALAGLAGSVALAVGLPILFWRLDTSLHSADELAAYAVPVLAVIPQAPTHDVLRRWWRYRARVLTVSAVALVAGLGGVSLYAKYLF
jgi:polysaccharide chain length determinant protein (PEP-CTERM system associated)